jgi:hypothetical protein
MTLNIIGLLTSSDNGIECHYAGLIVVLLSFAFFIVMLSVICWTWYADCRYAERDMLIVVMLSVIWWLSLYWAWYGDCSYAERDMLTVVMLSVICWLSLCWVWYADCRYADCRLTFYRQKNYAGIKRSTSVKYSSGSKTADTLEKLQTIHKKVEMPKVPADFQFSFSIDVSSFKSYEGIFKTS